MQDLGTVVERVELDVFHVESGLHLRCLMEAIIYRQPRPALVLTRLILTPNVTAATGSYTVISGVTLEEWKVSMEENDLMIWRPLPVRTSGLDLSLWS